MQAADTAAAKHSNHSLVHQAIAALYLHPQLHEHVVGWAPVRGGQLNAEVHLSFKVPQLNIGSSWHPVVPFR